MEPSIVYCVNKQQGLKPPQETTWLFHSEIENKLPNKETNMLQCVPIMLKRLILL